MITLKEAQLALARRESFDAGNLWARDNFGSYEVYSYALLIATSPTIPYASAEHSQVLDQAYGRSVTTSKHANIVKKAWGF